MKTPITILALAFFMAAKGQIITTISGNGIKSYSGDGGLSFTALLRDPFKICTDPAGNVFFSDCSNHCIRKIDVNGIITTVAGNGTLGFSGDGGPATSAQLNYPYGVYADGNGNIFIADIGNARIRKVDVNGVISTIAGNGSQGYSGDGGAATSAELNGPSGVTADGSGNVFIADCVNHRIRKVSAAGTITTIAGTGVPGFGGDGGQATLAMLQSPFDLTFDQAGNLYFADADNFRVRKIDATGIVTTIAGNGNAAYSGDNGPAVNAGLNGCVDVDLDVNGNIYITEQFNHCIRRIDASGVITTFAGTGVPGFSGDGGSPAVAKMNTPSGLACHNNRFFIADAKNQRIRTICNSTVAFNINATSTLVCMGNSADLTAYATNTYTYSWSTAQTATNSISVSPSVAATYYAQGKDVNGCVGSASIQLVVDPCAGIEGLSKNTPVRIYPNPARDALYVPRDLFSVPGVKITIVNSIGQVVRSATVYEKPVMDYMLDVEALRRGVYYLRIEHGGQTVTSSFSLIE